jgi:hypothetical protein
MKVPVATRRVFRGSIFWVLPFDRQSVRREPENRENQENRVFSHHHRLNHPLFSDFSPAATPNEPEFLARAAFVGFSQAECAR